MRCGRNTGRWPRVACPPRTMACGRWPRRLATRRASWRRFRPRRTWGSPAATRRRSPACGRAKWWSISAAAAGSTCSSRRKKVGPTGKAIGIDMTPEMLELARRNAAQSGVTQCRVSSGDHRQTAARRRHGRLRDQQLRDQPRARQAGRVPRNRPRAQTGRAAGGERHRAQATAAAGDRRRA